MKRLGLLLALALFIAPAIVAQVPAAPAGGIGFVDIEKVLKEYKAYQTIQNTLEKELESKLASVKAVEQTIRTMTDNLELYPPGSEGALDQVTKIKQAEMNRDLLKYRAQVEVTRKLVETMKKVYEDVKREVKAVASEKGMVAVLVFTSSPLDGKSGDQVFTSMMVRPVIYSDARFDITADVLSRLNK